MKVTFDPARRDRTLEKRGLDFARAGDVFSGPTLIREDDRSAYGERRRITIGYLDRRLVVLVWAERTGTRRIISLRKANEREQARYARSF